MIQSVTKIDKLMNQPIVQRNMMYRRVKGIRSDFFRRFSCSDATLRRSAILMPLTFCNNFFPLSPWFISARLFWSALLSSAAVDNEEGGSTKAIFRVAETGRPIATATLGFVAVIRGF